MRIGLRQVFAMFCAAAMLSAVQRCDAADDPSTTPVAKWVKDQIDDGRLVVEFYDPAKPPKPFPGWTDFEFRLEFRYDYTVEVPKKKKRGPVGPAVITPNFTKIEVPVKHRMQLPKYLESDRWYEAVLARHELDHVRVGLHPRLAMLGKHLVQKVTRFERPVENVAEVTADWVNTRMNTEIAARRDAIQALVLGINRKIDTMTNHGAVALPNREEFLAGLYLKENLDDMKFPYLSELLDLINTREYLQARIQTREADVELKLPLKN